MRNKQEVIIENSLRTLLTLYFKFLDFGVSHYFKLVKHSHTLLGVVHFWPRTTDTQREFFFKFQTFGLGQTFWAEIFWGIWGFGWTISTHFGTVSSLSMFSIIQPLCLQKLSLISNSQIFLWECDLNLRFSLRAL